MKRRPVSIPLVVAALAVTPAAFAARGCPIQAVDPAEFVAGVTHPLFPLPPGTTFHYQGMKDGVPSSIETYVTHQTEVIAGVTCLVIRDRAFENAVLIEDTIDWYAQDRDGNVWYFGEDTRELDPAGNVISTEGSWKTGVSGALPGIIMEADPHVGDAYLQECAPGVAEDHAQVRSLKKSACVVYGCFSDLLLTREDSPLDKGVVENKYYASGVGFVLGESIKGEVERTELVAITHD